MHFLIPTGSFALTDATRPARDADNEMIFRQDGGLDEYQLDFDVAINLNLKSFEKGYPMCT